MKNRGQILERRDWTQLGSFIRHHLPCNIDVTAFNQNVNILRQAIYPFWVRNQNLLEQRMGMIFFAVFIT